MVQFGESACLAILLVALLVANGALAAPYYYYYSNPDAPETPDAAAVGTQVSEQAQQVAGQAQGALEGSTKGVEDQKQQEQGGQLPHRLQGHLSELYTHGSSAMKGVVQTVQPDIKNIGKDVSEAYQVARAQVGKRIEPLAHTVRPYIDHAQKVVAPYVHQAREEVPKLINQAGPALSKVGGQMREGITTVWDKLSGSGNKAATAAPNGQQQVGEQVQHQQQTAVTDAAKEASQQVANAAKEVSAAASNEAASR